MKIGFPTPAIILGSLAVGSFSATGASAPAVIPLPQAIELQPGTFKLSPETCVTTDPASGETGEFLAGRLRRATGYRFKTHRATTSVTAPKNVLLLTTGQANTNLGPEGYELTVEPDSVIIRAPAQAGLFYGAQTLLQLLPAKIFSERRVTNTDWVLPCVRVRDWPRFPWRGLMLDVARHFYTTREVEQLLDAMADQKLNVFHWHLTDDQGWRIEIRKYPKLTQIGAWREGVGFGLATNATTAYGPDGRYGGFYTQADIREVVAYAAARHISVMPEIEMPGHATAALAAYPQFSCTGGPFTLPLRGGVFNGVYDPANEGTFTFLEDVLSEVFGLFPGKYIHIGGDEVPKDTWKKSPACQALIQREGLKDEEELQSWFTRRIEKFVSAHGRSMVGWSEILQGGLVRNGTVMDWIGGARQAAVSGHDVVMSPTGYCYLDQYQSTNRSLEPRAIGGFIPLEKTYAFDPVSADFPAQYASHILGAQGNLWTEYIPNLKQAEYMIFPRETALAEVCWSSPATRSGADFLRRLQVQCARFDELGVSFHGSAMSAPPAGPGN